MPRTQPRRERGAAAVEMAIILPVLLLLVGGIVDLGRAFMVQSMVTNAAREGTRAAYIESDPSTGAAKTKIEARATAAAQSATGIAGTAPTPATSLFTYACAAPSPKMTVGVTIQFKWLMLNALPGISNPQSISSDSVIGC